MAMTLWALFFRTSARTAAVAEQMAGRSMVSRRPGNVKQQRRLGSVARHRVTFPGLNLGNASARCQALRCTTGR
jgi:hypothetical protein